MKTYKLIVEAGEDGIWGRWENASGIVTAHGSDLEDLRHNFINALNLFLEEHEGWTTDARDVKLELQADLVSLFEVNDFINISKLADHIGMNKSLLRQYARGLKYPSLEQALKIEQALKGIASNLLSTRVITRER